MMSNKMLDSEGKELTWNKGSIQLDFLFLVDPGRSIPFF